MTLAHCSPTLVYYVKASHNKRKALWGQQGLNLQTKLNIYKAVLMTTLLYACETWTVYCSHARNLNRFHINCLHRLLHFTWQDMIPDTEGPQACRAAKPSCSTEECSTLIDWPCSQNERWKVTKAPAVWRTVRGRRSTGGQRKCYKDSLKSSQKAFEINARLFSRWWQ